MSEIREALESMVEQFAYHGVKNQKPVIHTGGLSALEEAFEVLGWDDPHFIEEEGNTCDVIGCSEQDESGQCWGELYLRLCRKHARDCDEAKPRPQIKRYALDREARRDPVTRTLK